MKHGSPSRTSQTSCTKVPTVISREYDCHDLITLCHEEKAKDDRFQFHTLLYEDYIQLDDALDYGHNGSDLMAIIWMEPGQHAVALAHGWCLSWDASHDTNWLRLKYFDFAVLGDYDLMDTIVQGLQRHEDGTTNAWILRQLRGMLGPESPCQVCFIDGDPASISALETVQWVVWAFDEFHHNSNDKKQIGPRIDFHSLLAKIYSIKYDDDVRTQGIITRVLEELAHQFGFDTYLDDETNTLRVTHPEDTLDNVQKAEGAKYLNNLFRYVKHWARCHYFVTTCFVTFLHAK
jgi:hypothetical protein